MKNKNLFLGFLQIICAVFFNSFSAHAGDGDFGAWVFNKDGHGGMNAGKFTFEGKDLAVEFWLYIDEQEGKNASGTNIISNRHNGNNGFSVSINKNSATGNNDIRFFFKNTISGGTASDQAFTLFLPRKEFSNKWAHVAFVISSSEKRAYSFLNGELYDVIEDFYTDWVGSRTTDDLCIGYWYADPKLYGKMADIRIWNKTRTIDEINQDYNKLLEGDEANLQLYYNFNSFAQTINNVVGNGKNAGSLLPAATWSTVHSYEVLAQKPTLLAISNSVLTWVAEGVNWDVEVRSKADNSLLKSETVTEKSFPLAGIPTGCFLKIRTFNNGVYSSWATIQDETTSVLSSTQSKMSITSLGDRICVTKGNGGILCIYDIGGRLLAQYELSSETEYINSSFLKNGTYICRLRKDNGVVSAKILK
jgi:hypothetical protein